MFKLIKKRIDEKPADNAAVNRHVRIQIAKNMLIYSLVHMPVAFFGILHPDPIIDRWYYPIVHWTAVLGPAVVGGQWYARVIWKDYRKKRQTALENRAK